MPYITQEQRDRLDLRIETVSKKLLKNLDVGEYNYVITKLIHDYIEVNGLRYKHLNSAIGILQCVQLELYRMVAADYEDIKIEENGFISKLDKKQK